MALRSNSAPLLKLRPLIDLQPEWAAPFPHFCPTTRTMHKANGVIDGAQRAAIWVIEFTYSLPLQGYLSCRAVFSVVYIHSRARRAT